MVERYKAAFAEYLASGSDEAATAVNEIRSQLPRDLWVITPEYRLKAVNHASSGSWDITNDAGDPSDESSVIDPPTESMAKRLVACFNACNVINDADPESVVTEMVAILREQVTGAADTIIERAKAVLAKIINS
jgi:hypothetical protein